jgi:hypothetical protein
LPIREPGTFNMGNFVFMNPKYVDGSSPDVTYEAVLRHETGHTLAARQPSQSPDDPHVGLRRRPYGRGRSDSAAVRSARTLDVGL